MELFVIVIMVLLILIIVSLLHWILKIKLELKQMIDVLEDINVNNSRQKFLIKSDNYLSRIKYLLNQIFYNYENQIEEFTVTSKLNQHLMASLSHDVRTPMTTLMGYLDAIYMRLIDDEKREYYIEMAKGKAYDLKAYIDVLFEWFRLNANEEIIHLERVDIAEVTREILKDWIPVLEENKIGYEIMIPDDVTNIEIDVSCYSRIINNIMQNVLTHSWADQITISAIQQDEMYVLTIMDNGTGIPEESLKYIFERLYKCDESRHDKGYGLGLNIVKILTEKMQGKVEAFSTSGNGTTFTVQFPVCK